MKITSLTSVSSFSDTNTPFFDGTTLFLLDDTNSIVYCQSSTITLKQKHSSIRSITSSSSSSNTAANNNSSRFISILKSKSELDIYDGNSRLVQSFNKKSDYILGIEFTFDKEIVIVTNQSLELHVFNGSKGQFQLKRSISLKPKWYIYSQERHILVALLAHSTLSIFHLKANSTCTQLPVINLRSTTDPIISSPSTINQASSPAPGSSPSHGNFQMDLTRRMVHIVTLYGKIYLAVVDIEKNIHPTLNLYRVTKSRIILEAEFEIDGEVVGLSVIDNIVLVHCFEKVFVFDLKYHNRLSLLPPQPPLCHFRNESDAENNNDTKTPARYYLSDYVLTCDCLYSITFNLKDVSKMLHNGHDEITIIDKLLEVLKFLCRRRLTEATPILLNTLKELLVNVESLWRKYPNNAQLKIKLSNSVKAAFDLIHESGSIFIKDKMEFNRTNLSLTSLNSIHAIQSNTGSSPHKRSSSKVVLITQKDMNGILSSFLAESGSDFDTQLLVTLTIKYITSLVSYNLKPDDAVYKTLVEALLKCESIAQLVQFLQQQIIEDSELVSRRLLQSENSRVWRLGLDMAKRLGSDVLVVQSYLQKKQVIESLKFAQSRSLLQKVSSLKFLDCAYSTKNKTLFCNTFKFLEDYGCIHYGERLPNVSPRVERGLDRYISIYRELFEKVVEMEIL